MCGLPRELTGTSCFAGHTTRGFFDPTRQKAQEYWYVLRVVRIAPANAPVNPQSIFNAVRQKINRQDVRHDLISDSLKEGRSAQGRGARL